MTAGVVVHAFDERTMVLAIAQVLHADRAVGRERAAVAADARRHRAVEHVGAERDHAEELGRRADAHDVAGLVLGEERGDEADLMEHVLLGFADAHAADGMAGEIQAAELFGAADAEVVVDRALVDAEEMTSRGEEAAVLGQLEHLLGPADGAVHGDFAGGAVARVGRALVEHHRDVGAERVLDVEAVLHVEEQLVAVEVGTEVDAFVGDRAELREREDLEAAAVREDRLVPVHELMETAGGADDLAARAQVEVVGVAEQDLGAGLGDLLGREALDRGLGAHRHEDRRADLPVRGLQDAEAGGRRRIGLKQGEHGAGARVGSMEFRAEDNTSG